MKRVLLVLMAFAVATRAEIPAVPQSDSPDGKLHAVMDIDRDPRIDPEWKGDSYPKIEITEKTTQKVMAGIEYFGAAGDDQRPVREHVSLAWRPDSVAFVITIHDRFYSSSRVYIRNKDAIFVSVAFPDYEAMTGFPEPDSEHLRPRGRASVEGWDEQGRLIYDIFSSPLPSFAGNDPLVHRVFLKVSDSMMTVDHVENEKGTWSRGDWLPAAKDAPAQPEKAKLE